MPARQPAMHEPASGDDSARRVLLKGWATTKWVLLILAAGVGLAGVVALGLLVMVTILQESV